MLSIKCVPCVILISNDIGFICSKFLHYSCLAISACHVLCYNLPFPLSSHISLSLYLQAFIKWAQWASTRPDIFPEELCNVLSSLQSGAPEHSFAFTNRQINAELGAPINQIFEKFSKKPIASGSIAQVYKVRIMLCGNSD